MSILNTVRLRSVRRVRLLSRYHPDEAEAEAVFGAILQHRAITQVSAVQYSTSIIIIITIFQLNISQNQISRVNPDTLARAVNNMEQVTCN